MPIRTPLAHSDPETKRDFVAYFGELWPSTSFAFSRPREQIQDVIQERSPLETPPPVRIESPEALGSFVNSCPPTLLGVYRAAADPVEDRESGETPPELRLADEQVRGPGPAAFSPNFPKPDENPALAVFRRARQRRHLPEPQVDREYLRVLAGPTTLSDRLFTAGCNENQRRYSHKDEYGASTGTCHESLGAVSWAK